MTPDMLLDALGDLDPALLAGAQARLMLGEQTPVKRRGGLRLRLLAAAAAAAVLLACLAALGIAVALFWRPETWSDILADWRQDLWKPVLLVLSLPLAGWFVLGGGDSPAQRKAE